MLPAGSGLRILIVEDNELDARTMLKSLAATPTGRFDAVRVADLASAVDLIDRSHFDCILLDLSLPDSTGLMSVDLLTERAPGCPIVVLTGLDDPETAVQAVERGAQDYLSKRSVDRQALERSIRYAVARQQAETALRAANAQLDLLRDRERIARDLHDTVIQQLFATGLGLESAAPSIADDGARHRVQDAVGAIDAAIRQLREAIFGLHAIPQNLALAQALTDLAAEKAEALGFDPIVEVGALPDDLPVRIHHEAVQVVSEGLSNVVRHAGATAVRVTVEAVGIELVVSVIDNGRGLRRRDNPDNGDSHGGSGWPEAVETTGGHGLRNMKERADSLEGRFHIGPGPGGGTQVEWRVPLSEP